MILFLQDKSDFDDNYPLEENRNNVLLIPASNSGNSLSAGELSESMMSPANDNISDIQVLPSPTPSPVPSPLPKSDVDDVFIGENACDNHEHGGKMALDEVFGLDVDYVFEILFTDSQFYRDFLASRKTTELIVAPWPDDAEEDGVKSRTITYTLSLNYKLGPKSTKTTEKQMINPDSRPGSHYIVDAEVNNLEVPYADTFYTATRFCLLKVSNNRTRVKVHCEIKYKKTAWAPIKGMYRNVISDFLIYFQKS